MDCPVPFDLETVLTSLFMSGWMLIASSTLQPLDNAICTGPFFVGETPGPFVLTVDEMHDAEKMR